MRSTFLLFLLYGTISVWAQVKIYLTTEIENDFINMRGRGTDHFYTGGNRLILWRQNNVSIIRSIGIGIMQQAYTPSDLQETDPTKLDYPYAGLLFCTTHLLMMAPEKKWRFYNTLSLGITGAKSGVAVWQRTIHRLIRDEIPKGWYLLQPVSNFIQLETQLFYPIWTCRNWRIEVLQKWEGGNFFDRFNYGLLLYCRNLPSSYSLFFNSLDKPRAHGIGKKIMLSFFSMAQHVKVFRNRVLEESLFREYFTFNSIGHSNYLREELILVSGGVGLTKGKVGCYITQHWQSKETMLSGAHSFGAIRLTFQLSKMH